MQVWDCFFHFNIQRLFFLLLYLLLWHPHIHLLCYNENVLFFKQKASHADELIFVAYLLSDISIWHCSLPPKESCCFWFSCVDVHKSFGEWASKPERLAGMPENLVKALGMWDRNNNYNNIIKETTSQCNVLHIVRVKDYRLPFQEKHLITIPVQNNL